MKKLIGSLLAVVLIVAIIFSFAACGEKKDTTTPSSSTAAANAETKASEPEKKEAVTVGYLIPNSWANVGGIKDLISKWEQQSGNKIDLQAIQDDQYDNLAKARLSSGNGIDIFFGAYNKYDVPNTMVEINGDSFVSRLNQVALDSLKYTDGKLYGYPRPDALGTWGVFYNKKIFSDLGLSIPKTFDDFEKVCAAIKAKGITPLYFAAKDGWTMLQHRNAVNGAIYASDADVWNKLNANKAQWKDIPGFVEQYKALEGWVKKGYINKDFATGTYEQQAIALAEGKAAMVYHGTFFDPELYKKKADAQIGLFAAPTKDGNNIVALAGWSGGAHIAKGSKVVDAAKDFLGFLIAPEQVKAYLTAAPGISGFKDVEVTDKLTPGVKDAQAIVSEGKVAPHGDDTYVAPMPYDELVATYTELLAGKITAEQFVQKHGDMYVKNAKQAKIAGF